MWVSWPVESLISNPMPRSSAQKLATWSAGAFCFKTMIMVVSPVQWIFVNTGILAL